MGKESRASVKDLWVLHCSVSGDESEDMAMGWAGSGSLVADAEALELVEVEDRLLLQKNKPIPSATRQKQATKPQDTDPEANNYKKGLLKTNERLATKIWGNQ